jgi:hypothetical protein
MARRQPRTILEACVARQGNFRGGITAARTVEFAWCQVDLGHFPTAVEYAEWAHVDERTSWRHRAAIRDVFGDEWENVIEQLARAVADGAPAHSRTLRVPVPA